MLVLRPPRLPLHLKPKGAEGATRARKGPPTFRNQGNVAPFYCLEERRPELRRAFLLPMRSLVKCIPDRPMHAGVIVMASRRVASRDIRKLQGRVPEGHSELPS